MALTAGCRPPPSAHMHTQTQTQARALNSPRLWANSYEMFLFLLHHTWFSNIIFRRHYSNTFLTLPSPAYSFRTLCSLCFLTCFLLSTVLSLHPPSCASMLSECRHLPMPVVMILSVRLVSCQTHRIYSGLFLMLTLMFLFFTRKEENGSVLELLSTNTPHKLLSNQEN